MIADFIHLRAQSSYSMLESALKIEKIIELTKKQQMPAICLADRGNLFGSLEFAIAASKSGIQPIIGSILNISFLNDKKEDFAEILLIAKNDTGYQNLLKLVSYTFIKNDRKIYNHITFEDLITYSEGIIALSCYTEGIIGKLLLQGKFNAAKEQAIKLQNIFGDRFYFEIMRHNLQKEQLIEEDYLKLAIELAIPLAATNNLLFENMAMHEAHDVLLCIAAGTTKEHLERKRVSNQCYFKSSFEMKSLFADLPEAIENTVHIAKRCNVMPEPRSPMLPNFSAGDISEEELFCKLAREGLIAKLTAKFANENLTVDQQEEVRKQYFNRLEYELNIINKMNFAGYFLIVSDFIRWCKLNNIPVGPGRGSGAGSVVAWSLLITDLDPLRFGLLFERFLNPERISMPDFDIDFCQERREEVIEYVRSKYGDDRVGQIITFGKMQAKAVIKDVSRVLGLKYEFADYLTELVPFNAVNPVTLEQAINEVAELKEASLGRGLYNLKGEESLIKQVLSTALTLEGLHRHASIHAAGIVIAGKDLIEILPVYKDMHSDMLIIQYSMKYAELAGLVKFDFLGLQTLTVIAKCIDLLKQQNIHIDFTNQAFDDKATYKMLSKGQSTGVFQFESVGMKDSLRRLKPDCIEDLIALGALYRPGPMDNIPTYIACKHGKQAPNYLHPLLKDTLEETYGVIIYQEQVMEIAQILSGYTLGAADLLRRAMGKKIKAEMESQEEMFVSGAVNNNVSAEQAKSIFAEVAKFAGYGFNKSHAAAYAVISYQTAFLKANFPAEFLVASMNLELDNVDKINLFIQEAKNNNIAIIPPCINKSFGYFTIENNREKSIIYALGAIKNVTSNFGKILAEERSKNGSFKSIIDLVQRISHKALNKKLLESLIKAGAFDALHSNRYQLLESVPKLIAYATSYHEEQQSNQFSLIKVSSNSKQILLQVPPQDKNIEAFEEFDVLGLFLSYHPLQAYANLLTEKGVDNTKTLDNLKDGSSQIKIAGIIQKKDSRMSARGRFITLQLSDQFGIFEVTIFSEEILKNYVHLLGVKSMVIVTCDLFKDQGGLRLTGSHFTSLEVEIMQSRHNLKLLANTKEDLKQIIKLLKDKISTEQTNTTVTILFKFEESFTAKIDLPDCFFFLPFDLSSFDKFKAA